ncbi:MAG TPA: hypothetical protein VFN10_20085 [Thermoanaerobaculia bacterium]|jgi:hypothetical protein|nr:hypothetical protein [Thermoanaerobaculia bacterium]
MSRTNGEKARAAIQKKRRTAQRESDRARKAEILSKPAAAAKTPAKGSSAGSGAGE